MSANLQQIISMGHSPLDYNAIPSVEYRYGRYMVLVYRFRGKRVSQYIGKDFCRQTAVLHTIERLQRIRAIQDRIYSYQQLVKDLEQQQSKIESDCSELLDYLRGE
jgi:hypothetical protein